jgi:hypothetical protein
MIDTSMRQGHNFGHSEAQKLGTVIRPVSEGLHRELAGRRAGISVWTLMRDATGLRGGGRDRRIGSAMRPSTVSPTVPAVARP